MFWTLEILKTSFTVYMEGTEMAKSQVERDKEHDMVSQKRYAKSEDS
jgi:hypothetical protein